MTSTVTLRPWQKAALERLAASTGPDFLAVATPGAGKTTFALTAARQALAADPGLRLVVVVPTAHLKIQWALAAAAFDIHLDWRWSTADGALPSDMHGVVTTYQQVAGRPRALRGLADRALVIFDELHHAAEDRAWGDALRDAFSPAPRRLALSGTPFRSDTHAIPFVRYHLDEAVPDYEYNYGDALADGGVVRPVYFPRLDRMMEWSAPDGSVHAHDFDDALDAARAGQRLRTAYSVDGEWLPHVLRQAHEQLVVIRRTQPDAGALAIATDQDHAKGIARLLADRLNVRAVVATSDDPDASARISRFAAAEDPWIVAVRMVAGPPAAAGRRPLLGGRSNAPGAKGAAAEGQRRQGTAHRTPHGHDPRRRQRRAEPRQRREEGERSNGGTAAAPAGQGGDVAHPRIGEAGSRVSRTAADPLWAPRLYTGNPARRPDTVPPSEYMAFGLLEGKRMIRSTSRLGSHVIGMLRGTAVALFLVTAACSEGPPGDPRISADEDRSSAGSLEGLTVKGKGFTPNGDVLVTLLMAGSGGNASPYVEETIKADAEGKIEFERRPVPCPREGGYGTGVWTLVSARDMTTGISGSAQLSPGGEPDCRG